MSGHRRRAWGWDLQWKVQRGLCWICLQPMLLEPAQHPKAMSIEHIVPKSRGGGESWRNKLLAHQHCNSARGAPYIWVKLNVFRAAAMARLNGSRTTVEGVDLDSSYPSRGSIRTTRPDCRPVTVPSEMAGKALRVTLAELSSFACSS